MMRRRSIGLALVALAATNGSLAAQQTVEVSSAVFTESYSFDSPWPRDRITQVTMPLGVDIRLGRFGNLALSTGFTHVDLSSRVDADQQITGFTDTEGRLGINVIPGRLVFILTGTVPSGITTLDPNETSILGALATDVIGFASSNVGAGGDLGGGFAGAIPVGSWAVGVGATFREQFTYRAVSGASKLRPGAEWRLRTGLEGPLGRRSYLRVAGVFARREKDEIGGATLNGVGNRYIGYVSFNQGIGNGNLIVYGFDVFRSKPSIEPTAIGAQLLPRGNLLAVGVRYATRLGARTSLTPRAEWRESLKAPSGANTALKFFGRSVRLGVDLSQQFSQRFTLVVEGSGIAGLVVESPGGDRIGLQGFRFALHGDWRP